VKVVSQRPKNNQFGRPKNMQDDTLQDELVIEDEVPDNEEPEDSDDYLNEEDDDSDREEIEEVLDGGSSEEDEESMETTEAEGKGYGFRPVNISARTGK
jgi:hypothetical protein